MEHDFEFVLIKFLCLGIGVFWQILLSCNQRLEENLFSAKESFSCGFPLCHILCWDEYKHLVSVWCWLCSKWYCKNSMLRKHRSGNLLDGHVVRGKRNLYILYPSLSKKLIWLSMFGKVYSILYSYVPFGLLATANALLMLTLYWRARTSKAQTLTKAKKQKAMNRTVISISLIFIFMTAFITVGSLFYPTLIQSYTGLCVLFFCDCMGFSYHGLNFFILFFTNKKFRQQFGLLFGRKSSHKVSAQHANSSTRNSVAKNSKSLKALETDDDQWENFFYLYSTCRFQFLFKYLLNQNIRNWVRIQC